jgi:hypothetical protein
MRKLCEGGQDRKAGEERLRLSVCASYCCAVRCVDLVVKAS